MVFYAVAGLLAFNRHKSAEYNVYAKRVPSVVSVTLSKALLCLSGEAEKRGRHSFFLRPALNIRSFLENSGNGRGILL